MNVLVPAFVGIPGGPELLIILVLAVLLFGADKLPGLARSSGEAMGEFKRGRDRIETEIKETAESTAAPSEPETDKQD